MRLRWGPDVPRSTNWSRSVLGTVDSLTAIPAAHCTLWVLTSRETVTLWALHDMVRSTVDEIDKRFQDSGGDRECEVNILD